MYMGMLKRLVLLIILFAGHSVMAQDTVRVASDPFGMIARPSKDSVVLRWAPLTVKNWHAGNQYGYMIERFTMVRNGKVVKPMERKQLTTQPLRPFAEAQWEPYVGNKYAMVAAQALYGETFQLDMAQGADIMTIVNKAKETEQRFSIALFCADMSPTVARASGLYFRDEKVEPNVKYLYRIRVVTPTDTLRGSVFVNTADKYVLPSVKEMTAEANEAVATLRWNQADYAEYFTTYMLERSTDNKNFQAVSDVPGVTLSARKSQDIRYQYAVDTMPSPGISYYYRIRGITPFGEYGPASNVVSVKQGSKRATQNPHITSAVSADNKSVDIVWDFPEDQNDRLSGFEVLRSATDGGPYKKLHSSILSPQTRTFLDRTPQQSNYYQVYAKGLDGSTLKSMSYLAMLVDSVPPAVPDGLKGKVDEEGNITISWKPNPDNDIFGYRIYRSYYLSEEFVQLTSEPRKDTTYADRVDLKNLNDKIHFKIVAIDRNQNHSAFSPVLSLALPDKVPPMPPVWLPVQSVKEGVSLRWAPSGSPDVVRYDVYRKGDQGQWMRIGSKPSTADSVYTYSDNGLNNSQVQYYTLIAVDDAGLESPPTPVVTGFKLPSVRPAVTLAAPQVDRSNKQIVLKWTYTETDVVSYRIYRKANNGELQLYKTIQTKEFVDKEISAGGVYHYQVVAVFAKGAMSSMGKIIEVKY